MEDNRENELLLFENEIEEEKVEEEVKLTEKQKEDLIIKEYIDNIECGIFKCVCCELLFTSEAKLHTHEFYKLFFSKDFLCLLFLPLIVSVNVASIIYNNYKEKREKNEKEYSDKVKDGIHKCVYCDKEYDSSSKLKLHHFYGYFKVGFKMLTLPVVVPYKLIQIGVKMIKNKDN